MAAARHPCACGGDHARGYEPIAGFRRSCADDLLFELRALQDQPPATLATLAAMLQDAGAVKLSCAVVGSIPFDRGQV